MSLTIIPVNLSTANAFVDKHHRHHSSVRGCKFCIGVVDTNNRLRGVVIAGRPVSRMLDDGQTLEVTRCCTDGIVNGCSKLYSTVAKIARHMGYQSIVTYTMIDETGASLRASGWKLTGNSLGGSWSCPARPRVDRHPTCPKLRWSLAV